MEIPGETGTGRLPIAGIFTDYGSDQGVVMVGRAAYHRPVDILGAADRRVFGEAGPDKTGERPPILFTVL